MNPSSAPDEKPALRSFFANRFVQAILLSGIFAQMGIWIRNFAILLFVTDQTNNDPVAVSLISVAEFAPIFVFSFIGGTFADRWKPKRTMIWSDILSAVSVFIVLLALVFGSWKAIFFATFVSSILSQFSQPSGMKLFKHHVDEAHMQLGMSLFQTLMAVFMIVGPMLGTYVYFTFGIDTAIAIMGICFLLSAVVLTRIPADRQTESAVQTKVWTDMAEGFRYVKRSRMLVALGGAFMAAGLALGLISPLGIFIVTERLGLSKDHLQWFTAVNGVAMIVGGGLAMGLSRKFAPQVMLIFGMIASMLTISVFGLTYSLSIALTAQFLSGLFMPAIQISISTLILKNTEETFVGRVNGTLNPLFMGSMVVTMSLSGVLKEATSLGAMYLASAVFFGIGVLVLLPVARLQSYRQETVRQE